MRIVIDSSVFVGLLVPNDLWHSKAVALWQTVEQERHTAVYFDCVAAEAISVAARRLHEKEMFAEFESTLERINQKLPVDRITWIYPEIRRFYTDVLDLMESTEGKLNFNDALIALACKERGIAAIASFDSDFDEVAWLRRISQPEDVAAG